MYGPNNLSFRCAAVYNSPSTKGWPATPFLPVPPLPPPPFPILPNYQLARNEFDSVYEILSSLNSEMSNSCSSGSTSYESPIPLASHATNQLSFINRTVSSLAGFSDSEDPLTRDCNSAGRQIIDTMKRKNERIKSELVKESSMIIKGMGKASRYSPEEKKERIERYRSKRNQRNFNKKIKYVCRKTLADTRIRVKGRFARNEESEKNSPMHRNHTIFKDSYEDEEDGINYWINFLNTCST